MEHHSKKLVLQSNYSGGLLKGKETQLTSEEQCRSLVLEIANVCAATMRQSQREIGCTMVGNTN